MSDPVSWLMIEAGWAVVARDGSEVGRVEEIVGDTAMDIFNGLSISTGFFDEPRYVPAERVEHIESGRVTLALDASDVEHLDEFLEPPPSLTIEGDEASAADRMADVFSDVERGPRRVTWWTRVLRRFFGRPGR